MYLHRVGDKVPPISKGAEDEQRRQVEPVVRVVQFRAPLKNLSDCDAAPYLRFFLVRNEEVVGSNPISSTKIRPLTSDPSELAGCALTRFSERVDCGALRRDPRVTVTL
jgi:hypothetical protein